jgi:hypothetical protein
MSLLDILNPPIYLAAPRRAVMPLGPWPEPVSPEKREAQRLNALKAQRQKRTKEQDLAIRRQRDQLRRAKA